MNELRVGHIPKQNKTMTKWFYQTKITEEYSWVEIKVVKNEY